MFRGNRDTNDREMRLGRQNAREVRRAACAGHDHFNTPLRCLRGVFKQAVGRPVSREHQQLVRHT